MSPRRDISLTPAERDALLERSFTVVLSSLDRRGYPHAVAMWYIVRDGCILMTTYAKSQKAVNLRRDPRCSVMLEEGREYHELRGILIRGRAELDTTVDAVLEVLTVIREKHGLGSTAPEVADAMRAHAAKRMLIKVVPERISSWDHGKLGGAY